MVVWTANMSTKFFSFYLGKNSEKRLPPIQTRHCKHFQGSLSLSWGESEKILIFLEINILQVDRRVYICRTANFPGMRDESWVWKQTSPAVTRINFAKTILATCGFRPCYSCYGSDSKISDFVLLLFKVHSGFIWQGAVLRPEVLGLALRLTHGKPPVLWGLS